MIVEPLRKHAKSVKYLADMLTAGLQDMNYALFSPSLKMFGLAKTRSGLQHHSLWDHVHMRNQSQQENPRREYLPSEDFL
jgi:hypothetical protein